MNKVSVKYSWGPVQQWLCVKVQEGLVSDSFWKLLDLEKFEVERSKLDNSNDNELTDKGHRVGSVWH